MFIRKVNIIVSMTGYGIAKAETLGKNISVEVKSVNSRYLDITCKMPRVYGRLEDKIKSLVGSFTTRGKVEIYINVENLADAEDLSLSLNHEYIANYLACIDELSKQYGLKHDLTVSGILPNRDIFTVAKLEEDDDILWRRLEGVLTGALRLFVGMKQNEGERLAADLKEKLRSIERILDEIENICPEIVKNYQERLAARIKELLEGAEMEEARLLTEVAIFADKVSVDEELVRLRSHIAQFYEMLRNQDNTPSGRKLEFLLQEINREINTIGSKSNHTAVARLIIEAKSEAEKIREQIQNIE